MQPLANPTSYGQGARPSSRRRIRSPPTKRRRTNLTNANTLPSIHPSPSSPPSPSLSQSRSPSPAARSPSPSPNAQPVPQSPAKWFRKPSVVWYRGNDLRVEDHPALLAAAQRGGPVVPFFVWDPSDGFGHDLGYVKKWWLRESLRHLQNDLRRLGVQLYTRTGRSTDELCKFIDETGADAVFWNRCYDPDLLKRDEELRVQLAHEGLTAESFKAELLVEPWELSNTDISPCFETFHSYMRAWMTVPPPPQPFPCPSRLMPIPREVKSVGIDSLGLDIPSNVDQSMKGVWKPGSTQAKVQLEKFLREVFPAFGEGRCRRHFDGTSRLSPHIRFGELSPRRMYHSTRLRVSQWDQTAIYSSAAQPATGPKRSPLKRPRPGRTKDHPDQYTELKPGEPHSPCREESGEREDCWDVGSSSVHKAVNQKQTSFCAVRDERAPKLDVRKERAAYRSRNKAPVYKRTSLPHISLSARAFLKNLCLRDFSYHVLFHNPDFNSRPLIPEFNNFPWAEDDGSFDSWINGVTGYPIVDAAMRELRETGWIHNGMRFLLACFLTKYLLLPWSRGLKAFYGLLVDGDHSANALGWQWTAGSNTDAFPVSCLVNPVKVAYRHDPSGSYVRRWIPELAKLPTEYIHQPWKAPKDLLAERGIDIGSTYPRRVVLMAQARSRASEAMSVMKQIFAGSTVRRSVFTSKNGDLIREWPESQPEVLRLEGAQPLPMLTGKLGLLPSLWALLQCDPPPSYLSGNASGSDALIAMDTASLVEGALPVPLDEQQESIEHALISAHEHGPIDPVLSAVCVFPETRRELNSSSFTSDPECETGEELRANTSTDGMDIQQLDEPLKYTNSDLNAFSDQEKHLPRSQPASSVPLSQTNAVANSSRGNQELPTLQQEATKNRHPLAHHNATFATVASQFSTTPQPHLQQQIQQLRQFQQLQALSVQHAQHQQQQQQTLGHLRHPTSNASSHGQIPGHQSLRRSREVQPQGSHRQHDRPQPQILHSQTQHGVPHASQAQSIQHPVPSVQHAPQSQHLHQPHHSHPQSVMDGLYSPSVPSNSIHGNGLPGVPLTAPPVMMGPVSSGPDISTGHAFGSGDAGTALCSHHLGMSQYYAFPPVLPVMNTGHLSSTERFEMLAVSSATNSQKLTVPGMMPVGYGMYGGGVFDPSVMSNPFTPSGNSYGIGPANSPNQAQPQQAAYGLPAHAMYCPQPPGADVARPQGGGGGNASHEPQPVAFCQSQPGSLESGERRTPMSTGSNMDAGAVGTREVAINVSSESAEQGSKHNMDGMVPAENQGSRVGATVIPASSTARSNRTAGAATTTGRGSSSRSGAKAGSKGKPSSRSRRTGRGSGSINRPNSEARGQPGGRGRGGDKGLQRKRVSSADKGQATTLKSRQDMLTSVLESREHEYRAFAQYLSATYELTGNTDRQTSRDYVRLCNLKDDYHKQYPAEKDKLKIYSMKRFFSQYLSLEVTGEWDRHNHGGVRGPYVYGVRARTQTESSGNATKS